MKHEDFQNHLKEIQTHQWDTLAGKSEQYSSDSDKFRNIKIGWPEAGVPHILHQLGKHLTAMRMQATGETKYSPERMRENCGDARNWIILLELYLLERNDET